MKVVFDTNVIIDVLQKREPYFQSSYDALQLTANKKVEGIACAGCITDIYYIISKSVVKNDKAKETIISLEKLISICDTLASDITLAYTFDMKDFEDAVLAATAKREEADYIVTRNYLDFINSPVPAIDPAELVSLLAADVEATT